MAKFYYYDARRYVEHFFHKYFIKLAHNHARKKEYWLIEATSVLQYLL